jgi:hypothetical protein
MDTGRGGGGVTRASARPLGFLEKINIGKKMGIRKLYYVLTPAQLDPESALT